MLLIPIGQETNVVRRMPWVSAVLIAVNLLVFLALGVADDGGQAVRERLGAFGDYLAARPYLSVPPDVGQRLGADFARELERAREAWRGAGGEIDPGRLQAEQQHLDALSDEVLRALRAMPVQRLGYVPADPSLLTALSSMFVHAGLVHVAGNLLFLFLSGPFVEDLYGRPLFAALYFLSGWAALGAHAAHAPDSLVPLVGASGAIAGVMGAFLVRLARARIRLLVLPLPILWMLRFKVWLPAFVVLPLWFAEQFWLARTQSGGGVAFWAHVGGFAFGAGAALAIKLARVEERFIHPAIEKRTTLSQDPGVERALEARLRGDFESARRGLRGALERRPDNLDAWVESYEVALAAEDRVELGRALPRLLGLYQRLGETDLARGLVYDRRWRDLSGLPAALHLSVAAGLERLGDGRGALDQYQRVIDQAPQDAAALRALVRRGALLREAGELRRARDAYTRARAHPACSDAWPALVERALGELAQPRA